jgi:hypothetical protein
MGSSSSALRSQLPWEYIWRCWLACSIYEEGDDHLRAGTREIVAKQTGGPPLSEAEYYFKCEVCGG